MLPFSNSDRLKRLQEAFDATNSARMTASILADHDIADDSKRIKSGGIEIEKWRTEFLHKRTLFPEMFHPLV